MTQFSFMASLREVYWEKKNRKITWKSDDFKKDTEHIRAYKI